MCYILLETFNGHRMSRITSQSLLSDGRLRQEGLKEVLYSRKFSWMGDLVTFRAFTDVHDCAVTSVYKRAYFADLIFVLHELTMKTAKIRPLENFPLYSS